MGISKHFVTFYSPGTFFSEQTTEPIGAWDPKAALAMASNVTERYGAKPYGFQFTTRTRGDSDLDSNVSATSPRYYFGVKVESLADVKARGEPEGSCLITNMECNGWPHIVSTIAGWKATLPLMPEDVVLDAAGQPIPR